MRPLGRDNIESEEGTAIVRQEELGRLDVGHLGRVGWCHHASWCGIACISMRWIFMVSAWQGLSGFHRKKTVASSIDMLSRLGRSLLIGFSHRIPV
jgi:hypothetical protein